VKEAARPPVSVVYGTGGKVKKSFEIGRQSPPSFREGSMETNNGM
jgi:hypothetical protein